MSIDKIARGLAKKSNDRLSISFINVKYPPTGLVGAKGDGQTDDWAAIQAIIDWCFENNVMTIFFPNGTYNISKPLLLKTKYESSPIPFWSGKAIKLIGYDMATTKIVKTTTGNTLSGVHAEVNGIDATIILFNGLNSTDTIGGSGTGTIIENLYIINQSTSNTSMTITGAACQRMKLSNLNIFGYSGIVFDNCYGNIFEHIVIKCTEKALWLDNITASGTSNTLINIYAINCHNPYRICAAYTGLDTVYADNCTGTIFDTVGSGLVMLNCGTESPKAQYIVKSTAPYTINIQSLSIWRQIGDAANSLNIDDCAVFYGSGKFKIGVLSILEDSQIIGNSYLYSAESINDYGAIDIGQINYRKNYEGEDNPKLLYTKQASNSYISGKISVTGANINIRRNKYMPYLGSRGLSDSLDVPFIDKAIYLDNVTKFIDSEGISHNDDNKYNVGDVLLINNPSNMNILGYVVSANNGTYVSDCDFKEIPIALRGSTSQRPSTNLYNGLQYWDTTLEKPIWLKYISGGYWTNNVWASAYNYNVGNLIVSSGKVYKCTTAGTSGGVIPTFNTTTNETTVDNIVVWTCAGDIATWVDAVGNVV